MFFNISFSSFFLVAGGRGRFPPAGRGSGFRNEGVRGRGNFGSGGRGFNRGGDFGDRRNDFGGSRNEYGNRGGGRGGAPPNRGGGDGYQRERVNRGMAVNGTAKNMAPRVPATA